MNFIIHVIDETSYYRERDGIFGREKIKDDEDEFIGDTILSDGFYLSSVESKDPIDAVIDTANIIEIENERNETVNLSSIIAESKEKESDEEYIKILKSISNTVHCEQTNSAIFSHSFFLTKEDDDGIYYEHHKASFFSVEEGQIMKVVEKDNDI